MISLSVTIWGQELTFEFFQKGLCVMMARWTPLCGNPFSTKWGSDSGFVYFQLWDFFFKTCLFSNELYLCMLVYISDYDNKFELKPISVNENNRNAMIWLNLDSWAYDHKLHQNWNLFWLLWNIIAKPNTGWLTEGMRL